MIKEKIPVYIKAPIGTVMHEYKYVPFSILKWHVIRAYVESKGLSEKRDDIYHKINRATYDYLSSQYSEVIDRYHLNQYSGDVPESFNIWLFWWQGEEKAPVIVRRCIDSVRKHAGYASVILISSENYMDYIDVPDHIIKKMQEKKISFTHFSDYCRMALLAKYGGLWIDSSIFMKNDLPVDLYQKPLFTVRNPGKDKLNISEWNWTVGVIGGWKNNTLFCAVRDLLSEYWLKNDYLIDYFVFDYMVKLVYESCSDVKRWITEIPANNSEFYFLQDHINESDQGIYEQFTDQDTWLYKISWKGEYSEVTDSGELTVYGKWFESTDRTGE